MSALERLFRCLSANRDGRRGAVQHCRVRTLLACACTSQMSQFVGGVREFSWLLAACYGVNLHSSAIIWTDRKIEFNVWTLAVLCTRNV